MSRYLALLVALFLSGAAGLVNQITWQRAVKVSLANSESLSAMIVVLVFMLGLGLGSIAAARRSAGLGNPFGALGAIEIALAATNGILIAVFGEELRQWAAELQAGAVAADLSPQIVSAALAFVVLVVPCFLMGLTIPIAAEGAQRQLRRSEGLDVVHLFVVNTLGAVLGTLGCGFVLLPLFGQDLALASAASANLVSGVLVLVLLAPLPAPPRPATAPASAPLLATLARRGLREEEALAFFLGLVALSYEVYLFRILALAYTPLPWIFSFVLCFYLLFWTAGVELAHRLPDRLARVFTATAATVAVVPFVLAYQRHSAPAFPIWGPGLVYFLPCLGFGLLFGLTLRRYVRNWGRDVGVFTALNTAGSCLGVLATTFLLFEVDPDTGAWLLAAALLLPWPHFLADEHRSVPHRPARLSVLLVFLVACSLALGRTGPVPRLGQIEFHGREGVVEVRRDGRVYIGGLWHSQLFRDDDEVAKSSETVRRKMLIALLPYLAHSGEPTTVLNVGLGTGATARTLAKATSIERVDAYEIVDTVREVIEHFPAESLGTERLEKIHPIWQDARTGLITNPRRYDIITQSPLYLNQAGSSFLLSREYFELLQSRLAPGGVAGIYCNSMGNSDQALLVRRTVQEVFSHTESFANGYFLLASDRPISLTRRDIERKLRPGEPLTGDVRRLGVDWILSHLDRPRLDWTGSPLWITDDHPLVEYPRIISWFFARYRANRD